jgi:hypothetical protein
MHWMIHSEVRAEVRALEFCEALLEHFDTSSLDWVRIDLGRGRIPGAYGRCWYPTRPGRSLQDIARRRGMELFGVGVD